MFRWKLGDACRRAQVSVMIREEKSKRIFSVRRIFARFTGQKSPFQEVAVSMVDCRIETRTVEQQEG